MIISESERNSIRNHLLKEGINSFWYFFSKENLLSILGKGILSQNIINNYGIKYNSFANQNVQRRRHERKPFQENTVHDYVPVYLNPISPTFYAKREEYKNFIFLEIPTYILLDNKTTFCFTNGNAGSRISDFFYEYKDIGQIPFEVIKAKRWNDFPDGKRKRNAEFLFLNEIKKTFFYALHCFDPNIENYLKKNTGIKNIKCYTDFKDIQPQYSDKKVNIDNDGKKRTLRDIIFLNVYKAQGRSIFYIANELKRNEISIIQKINLER